MSLNHVAETIFTKGTENHLPMAQMLNSITLLKSPSAGSIDLHEFAQIIGWPIVGMFLARILTNNRRFSNSVATAVGLAIFAESINS